MGLGLRRALGTLGALGLLVAHSARDTPFSAAAAPRWAGAQAPSPTDPVVLELLRQGRPVVGDDAQPFTLRIAVDVAALPDEAPDLELAVTVHERATTDAFLDGGPAGSVLSLQRLDLGDVVDPAGRLVVDYALAVQRRCDPTATPPTGGCLQLADDGVHPVVAELRRVGGGPVRARFVTALVAAEPLATGTIPPLAVATVLSVGLGPDADAAPLIAAAEEVLTHPGVPVALAPEPTGLARLDRDPGGRAVLDTLRLAAARTEVLGRPFAEVTEGLGSALDRATLELNSATGLSVTEELIGQPVADDVRLVPPGAALGGADQLDARVTRVILPGRAVEAAAAAATRWRGPVALELERAEGEVPLALVVDDAFAQDLWRSDARTNMTTGVLRVHRSLARLAVESFQRRAGPTTAASGDQAALPPTATIVIDPRSVGRSGLAAWMDGLSDASLARPTALAAILDAPALTTGAGVEVVRAVPAPNPDADARTLANEAVGARDRLVASRSLIETTAVTGPDSLPLHQFLDALALSNAGDGLEQLRTDRPALDALLAGVQLVRNPTFRLTSTSGEIPIRITNTTGRPVRISLVATSDRVSFPGVEPVGGQGLARRAQLDLVVEGPSAALKLPIATSAAGAYVIQLDLSTPSGRIVSRTRYTVRSTGLSGVGLGLTVAALATLAGWWLRSSVTSRRAAQRSTRTRHPAASAEGDDHG